MRTVLLAIPFLLMIVLIVHAERSFSYFTIWNSLPIVMGFCTFVIGLRMHGGLAVACFAFGVTASFFITLFHLAWMFDWRRIATGSSTSGLAFIFMPIWALIFAVLTAAAAWGVSRLPLRSRASGERK